MTDRTLSVQRGAVARTLTLRRSDKRNAIDDDLRQQLIDELNRTPDSGERVVVLRAEGSVFSAGNDLALVRQAQAGGPEALAEVLARDLALIRAFESTTLPTIAVLEGRVIGFAAELVAACDWVIANSNATFSWPEPQMGILPSGGASTRLGRAYLWRWLRSPLSAVDAAKGGLIDLVLEPPELEAELASLIAWVGELVPLQFQAWRAHIQAMRVYAPGALTRLPGLWSAS